MTKRFRIVWGLAAALALSACGANLKEAETMSPSGTAFENALFDGYRGLSRAEKQEQHFVATDVFASRAIAVANGQTVLPEAVTARDLPGNAIADLIAARARLMVALDKSARDKIPDQAARAQVMFDCWMEEQEENLQPADIARCRAGFEDAMAQVEAAMVEPEMVMEPEPAPPPPPPAPMPPLPGRYIVYFDFDDATITQEAARVISEASWGVEGSKTRWVVISGHTDTSGASGYNLRLSEARADAVVEALIAAGVNPAIIVHSYSGETINKVPTGDNVREVANRRVEITLER